MEPSARIVLETAKRRIVEARAALERVILRLDRLEHQIGQVLSDPRQSIDFIRSAAENARRLKVNAARGARFVRVQNLLSEDGRTEVQIDNLTVFLPPKLASLLEVLATDEGEVSDRFVGWKRRDAIWDALAKRHPGASDPAQDEGRRDHTITNLISRLRKELAAQGLHPAFVQTDRRRRAVRVAVLRMSPMLEG